MDLLIKLNQEDGITMVMVTHDPNLKNAADRVVYMRDGKIHRIEELDPEVKIAFRKSIAEQNTGALTKHEGTSGVSNVKSRFTSATVRRRPLDYETYDRDAVLVAHNVLDEYGKRREGNVGTYSQLEGTTSTEEPSITTANPTFL